MGGTDAGRLSATNTLGGSGGAESFAASELVSHTHTATVTNATVASTSHTHTEGNFATAIGAVNNDAQTIGYEAGSVRPSGRGPTSTTNYVATGLSIYNGAFGPLTFNHYTRVYGTSSTPTGSTTISVTNANNTTGVTSTSVMQPYLLINYIIKT
jgi:microcystin-dependent protein